MENARVSKDLNTPKHSKNDSKNHALIDGDENTNTFHENEDVTSTSNDCIPEKSPVPDESQENALLDDWLDSVLDD